MVNLVVNMMVNWWLLTMNSHNDGEVINGETDGEFMVNEWLTTGGSSTDDGSSMLN